MRTSEFRATRSLASDYDVACGAQLAEAFDQGAAVAAMARLATFKAASEESIDVVRWLDRRCVPTSVLRQRPVPALPPVLMRALLQS